ncbi:hypothetical protein ACFFFP_08500 [Thermus composti]|uniref:Uncharacterized protein n=1 Tax=Thermus composti TaxID=532059 RepID=A0ABV6Q249_9DEIN|nr:hypothetical protein [Thermus composti]
MRQRTKNPRRESQKAWALGSPPERLPPEDPRRPIAQARVARLRREWGL